MISTFHYSRPLAIFFGPTLSKIDRTWFFAAVLHLIFTIEIWFTLSVATEYKTPRKRQVIVPRDSCSPGAQFVFCQSRIDLWLQFPGLNDKFH